MCLRIAGRGQPTDCTQRSSRFVMRSPLLIARSPSSVARRLRSRGPSLVALCPPNISLGGPPAPYPNITRVIPPPPDPFSARPPAAYPHIARVIQPRPAPQPSRSASSGVHFSAPSLIRRNLPAVLPTTRRAASFPAPPGAPS